MTGNTTETRKQAPFYITTPTTLADGTYEVNLKLTDKAGNSYLSYLSPFS